MKTRTIKELLILLRDELPKNISNDYGGSICFTIIDLNRTNRLISGEEEDLLLNHVKRNVPSDAGNYDGQGGGGFWWPYGELAPRMEFLDKLIGEL